MVRVQSCGDEPLACAPAKVIAVNGRIDARLVAIVDPQLRLLLCRWAAAMMAADGCVTHVERLECRHVLRCRGNSPMAATAGQSALDDEN